MHKRTFVRPSCIALAVAAALAAGCANFAVPDAATGGATATGTGLLKGVPQGKLDTLTRKITAEGVRAMEARDWRKASDLFNLALQTDVRNSHLQLLNAYVYHQRGRLGESGLLALAEEGYALATQFDHSNWTAHYLHGVLAMERREYLKAQSNLMKAALYADADRDLLYELAVASYYAQDPKTAAAALEGLRRVDSAPDARVLRASAIVAASLNDRDAARGYVEALRKISTQPEEVALVERRVKTWEATHEREPLRLAQFTPSTPGQPVVPVVPVVPVQPGAPGYGQPPGHPGMPGFVPGMPGFVPGMPGIAPGFPPGMQRPMPRQPGDFVEKNMVAIDVVIINTEEDLNNRMGVNLLDGLRLQFGNPDTRQAGISQLRTVTRDPTLFPRFPFEQTTNVVTRLISIPAVSYTLNIANAAARRNHVLARPTLVALGGQTSQFFSGVDVNAAAVSGGQGAPVQITKEVGVKLAVTPEFLPEGLIRLQVIAERTFLTNPSANVVFDFRLDTTKTTVNANVVMRFGETLILSGLSERDSTGDRSGVPFLQDVPVAQYFFSENADREFYKSVMIMLTPRRPQYTYQDPAIERAEREKLSAYDREIVEFEQKYREWFRPLPNSAAAFRHLSESSLFREFRTGDLSLYDWNARRTLGERLKASIDFLYY